MYQAEEKIEFIVVANNIAHWAETLFGYFVKANKNDDEKLELIEAFAEELEKIPSECMFYLQQAKDKWIQEAHQRPPSVSQFLQILRELNNAHVNQKYKTMIEHRQVDYAGLWGICKTDELYEDNI